ncbi:MAG: class I SAM-dependent methyltransferase [Spirochaetaceae bacterium]|nr:class I SAM-dependent methyltransferase [Spirochaetaceae bacterium]
MPKMTDIYKNYAIEYDKLVSAEDYQNNLTEKLLNKIDWNKKVIYEAGIGTGRLSKIYIDKIERLYGFDREDHMLDRCKMNLNKYSEKVILNVGENENLPLVKEKADIFIEGWSFGHTIVENNEDINKITEVLIKNIKHNITTDGTIVFLETMGTNVIEPGVDNKYLSGFYKILEEEYNFTKSIIKTDYKFKDYKEAAEIIGFFFGDEMGEKVLECKSEVVPEYTGIWIKNNMK